MCVLARSGTCSRTEFAHASLKRHSHPTLLIGLFKDDASPHGGPVVISATLGSVESRLKRQAARLALRGEINQMYFKLRYTYFHWILELSSSFWYSILGPCIRRNMSNLLKSTTHCREMAKNVRRTPMKFTVSVREANDEARSFSPPALWCCSYSFCPRFRSTGHVRRDVCERGVRKIWYF